MSARHRPSQFEPTSFEENRAHARAERQRIRAALHAGSPRVLESDELDDLIEPGPGYRTPHHPWHPNEHSSRTRVWKLPFWKRRSAARQNRAEAARGSRE